MERYGMQDIAEWKQKNGCFTSGRQASHLGRCYSCPELSSCTGRRDSQETTIESVESVEDYRGGM